MDHPRPGHDLRTSLILAVVAVALFIFESQLFGYPLAVGVDAFVLAFVIFIPGFAATRLFKLSREISLGPFETISLSGAIGFGLASLFALLKWEYGFPIRSLYIGFVVGSVIALAFPKGRKVWYPVAESLPVLFISLIGVLCLLAISSLPNLRFLSDGAIQTRGLFGVDIPFLAGEIHGIRDFHALRDLHQSAQAWSYHDWTYQLLALLPRERTIDDVALASPIVGYTLLAVSIFALVLRLTKRKYTAGVSVIVWFVVSGLNGGELGSYALSPSFVYGSVLFLNALLVVDTLLKANKRQQWIYVVVLAFLLIVLLHTKLTSFLVLLIGLGLLGLLGLRRRPYQSLAILGACVIAVLVFAFQMSSPNRFMPGGDFLIGAPLLGYANHVAAALHQPVSSFNPVSVGLHLKWQSILILPYFLFYFLRFVVQEPKLLAVIIIIALFGKVLWKESGELAKLLLIMVPLGFLLPVLYSPAWYPLALSFNAPLVSLQAAVILLSIAFGILSQREVTRFKKAGMGLVGIVLVIGFGMNAHSVASAESIKADIVPACSVQAMHYLTSVTNDSSIIATHRFDLDTTKDESFYWYSALSGRAVISEGAKYGSLLSAVADTNSEKGLHPIPDARQLLLTHRAWLDTIYISNDPERVHSALAASKVSYILQNPSKNEHLAIDLHSVADSIFACQDCIIWHVRSANP